MITPEEIKQRALKYWTNQRALRAWLNNEALFPLSISIRRPHAQWLLDHFAELRQSIVRLEKHCQCSLGYGYRIEYVDINHRQLGLQRLPKRVVFDHPLDLFRYIGKQRDFARLARLEQQISAQQPELRSWIAKNPLKVLEQAEAWPQLLATLDYFRAHPCPGRYLRELDIPDVDSKFIEQHKALLYELLDGVLPEEAKQATVTGLARHGFERRYGLKYEEPLIRFRMLDPAVGDFQGLSDITVPLSQFQQLKPDCRRVFITENKINGLSFPTLPSSIVVFGLGYGISSLKGVVWLNEKSIFYWGDIDTHGFAILSQLRRYFPQTRSLLMDRDTLRRFRALWVKETDSMRFTGILPNLSHEEQALYHLLRDNELGLCVRLEQERISYEFLLSRLETLEAKS
jgi:hypothetical protein